ncbi:unnamed protein product [Enterobius vermicularis]|uniref:Guanylate cyclase n=1 Tax=Enterobius vermicularis TaxID=51028 RepID=A0A0N4UUL4_ENTVE|nr:unnamed protein product [Enterobius vermicularis]
MGKVMNQGDNYLMFVYFSEPVMAVKHNARPKITKNDAAVLRFVNRDNLNRFLGLCIDGPQYLSVWKYCSHGSLQNLIEAGTLNIDTFFMLSIMRGLCEVSTLTVYLAWHGNLTSSCCLLDERWQVKISEYGLHFLKRLELRPKEIRNLAYLWTAPELLRQSNNIGTKEGDIYSFAIICSEIVTKKPPFDFNEREESVEGEKCWAEDPSSRPDARNIREVLNLLGQKGNLMDHVYNMMEEHAQNLEEEVEQRTQELIEEQKKSDRLLYRMLPKQVAEKLKRGETVIPESFDAATVFFSDVVKFTELARKCTPIQVVCFLNNLYTVLDAIIEQCEVYKVESIGDGYLCVSGLPHRNGNDHAREIAEMAFKFLSQLKTFVISHLPEEKVRIRIGIHTGPVVAGVIGQAMPRYCLFGDTVNTASRMESNGEPDKIHISSETNRYLTQVIGGYQTECRGDIIIKGKGVMKTFWLIPPDLEVEKKESNTT